MRDMHIMEQMFVDKLIKPGEYLVKFLKLSSKKHLLEKKKIHNYSPEALISTLVIQAGLDRRAGNSCLA